MQNRTQSGFTLLEVLIALAILSGVVVAIMVTLNNHLNATQRIREVAEASLLASEVAEEFSLTGLPQAEEGEFPAHAGYRWRYSTEALEIAIAKKVYITVSKGKSDIVTLETYR